MVGEIGSGVLVRHGQTIRLNGHASGEVLRLEEKDASSPDKYVVEVSAPLTAIVEGAPPAAFEGTNRLGGSALTLCTPLPTRDIVRRIAPDLVRHTEHGPNGHSCVELAQRRLPPQDGRQQEHQEDRDQQGQPQMLAPPLEQPFVVQLGGPPRTQALLEHPHMHQIG